MGKKLPIFYSAFMLTGVNLLLRFAGTSFQVYLSGQIGAAGIGLLQLVLSVGSLSMTMAMAGIRTATMYLSAEAIGQKKHDTLVRVLSSCVAYSLVSSTVVAGGLYAFSETIAANWIGNISAALSLKLLACFLPVNCLCGVMVGYYTGINRIGTLAAVEVAEQFFAILITVLLLRFWVDTDTVRACQAVILGSGLGACLTLVTLLIITRKRPCQFYSKLSFRKKLWKTAIPLAAADNLKAGINTTENLMVPKRLSLFSTQTSPLATFGMVCGMVFPILMFPACILFGLTELLIPELARCEAAGSKRRIQHLVERSLLLAMVYGCFCGGTMFLFADTLCDRLYHTAEPGAYLRWFALLAPMLYCDAIVDAITKGLGQQIKCVRNNIITSALDVILLYVFLPKYGMLGYFGSFLITHLLNFILSILLLQRKVTILNNILTTG